MNTKKHITEVKNKFYFGYLDHDLALEKDANLKLIQLLPLAPPGATGIGLVEKTELGFLSTASIRSPFRSFTTQAIGTNARSAVDKALERLENELFRWRSGNGSGNYGGRQLGISDDHHLRWPRTG